MRGPARLRQPKVVTAACGQARHRHIRLPMVYPSTRVRGGLGPKSRGRGIARTAARVTGHVAREVRLSGSERGATQRRLRRRAASRCGLGDRAAACMTPTSASGTGGARGRRRPLALHHPFLLPRLRAQPESRGSWSTSVIPPRRRRRAVRGKLVPDGRSRDGRLCSRRRGNRRHRPDLRQRRPDATR